MMKKIILGFLIFLIPLITWAENITDKVTITIDNYKDEKITDDNELTYITVSKDKVIKTRV